MLRIPVRACWTGRNAWSMKTLAISRASGRWYSSGPQGARQAGVATQLAVAVVGAGLGYYAYKEFYEKSASAAPASPAAVNVNAIQPVEYYKKVAEEIANVLENPKYDDGSYGPLLVRLAWHASGTYDKKSGTGGSNGATMRFAPESTDGANAGLGESTVVHLTNSDLLGIARDLMEKVKKKFPEISYADLWTLSGVVAVKEMGGPVVSWRPGRSDVVTATQENVPPNGRLPDALKKSDHIRDVFYRMGFDDQEIVALLGAHSLGRCHTDRSGFTGPWSRAPTTFSNQYFKLLLEEKWTEKKWNGPKQFEDKTKDLMMLVSDLALIEDPEFKKYVVLYAKDEELFFKDYSKAFQKLLELGVPFPLDSPTINI